MMFVTLDLDYGHLLEAHALKPRKYKIEFLPTQCVRRAYQNLPYNFRFPLNKILVVLQLKSRGFFPRGGGNLELHVSPLQLGKALQVPLSTCCCRS